MEAKKKDLIDVLNTSVQELQKGIDMHHGLVTAILEEQVSEDNLGPVLNLCPKRSRELRLEAIVKETIDTLEESRKAFKSKRLEILRKKLTQVLIDTD